MSNLVGRQTDEEKLFAIRAENQILIDRINSLELQIEAIKKKKRSGKIRIIIDQLSDDLKFMKEAGDLYADLVYHDDKFVRFDPVELVHAHSI